MELFENKRKKQQFILSYITFMMNGMLALSIGSLLPFIRDARGLEYTFCGMLVSLHSVGNLLSSFFAGALAVKIGRKKSILLFNASYALAYLMILIGGNPVCLALAFILTGMARGATSNFSNMTINNLAPGQAWILNGLHAMFSVGAFLFPIFLTVLTAGAVGRWRIACVFMLAMGILSWLLYRAMPVDEMPQLMEKVHRDGEREGAESGNRENTDRIDGGRENADRVNCSRENVNRIDGGRENADRINCGRENADRIDGGRENADRINCSRENVNRIDGHRESEEGKARGRKTEDSTGVGKDGKRSGSFFGEPMFILCTATLFFYLCVEQGVIGWLVTYFKDTGLLNPSLSQIMASVQWVMILAGRLTTAYLSTRLEKTKLLRVMGIGLIVFFLVLITGRTTPQIVIGIMGFGYSMAGIYPTTVSFAGKLIQKYPLSWSFMLTIASLGSILMPSVIGRIAESAGIFYGMSSLVVVIVIDMALIIGLTAYRKRKEAMDKCM